MMIRLKNGADITLPVGVADADSITFGEARTDRPSEITKGGAVALPLAPTYLTNTKLTRRSVIRVGRDRSYRVPSDAVRVASDGDVVEIDAGLYVGDVAVWRQNNLTLRGVGGRARLEADGAHAEGKAIWVIKGANTTVENIEFSGAQVPDKNGAGIRLEGPGLTIRGSSFYDNEVGILTGANDASDIVIENSEFARNGVTGYSQHGLIGHNIYIGRVRSFTLRYSYVHHAKKGHNVKSRAQRNFILYSRLMDEATGTSSYIVDLPNGGISYIIGNLIQQGRHTENRAMVSFAAEGASNPTSSLFIVNNTFVNDRGSGIFVANRSKAEAQIFNNIFVGGDKVLKGLGELARNLVDIDPGFVDGAGYDYRLGKGSPAIDVGVRLPDGDGFPLFPAEQYVHPMRSEERVISGPPDAGAYEYRELW